MRKRRSARSFDPGCSDGTNRLECWFVAEAREIISLVGDAASVIGLAVTVLVALSVRRLRKLYVFKGRARDLTARIAERASSIMTLASDFGNSRDQISVEVRRVAVLVDSLARKSSGVDRTAAIELVQQLNSARLGSRAEVTELYGDIQALVARFEELQRDREWEHAG